MCNFKVIKDIFECLYYCVGIAGLITIYYTVKNNIDSQKEKKELKNKNELLEKQNRENLIRNFKISVYKEFERWMGETGNRLQLNGYNFNDYIRNKKLPDKGYNVERIAELISDVDSNKMQYYIEELNKVVEIYAPVRIQEKDDELDQIILKIFQGCIIECDLLSVPSNYPKIYDIFVAINKETFDPVQ